MGTPDFAVPCLERLVLDGHELAGVFSQPDRPKGRGHSVAVTPVKACALAHEIPVEQPEKLRDGSALEILKRWKPELIVVVAYGRILPVEILELPKYGCINIHGSLLPKYRGAAPIQWSVISGDEFAGVTAMYMAQGLDTGDMIASHETPIGEDETSGELYARLAEIGAQTLSETVGLIASGQAKRIPQDDSAATLAPMLTKELARLDFSRSARELHNLTRGMNPWPIAHTTVAGAPLKVYAAREVETQLGTELSAGAELGEGAAFGTVIEGSKRLRVKCGDGVLEIIELQAEGKKRMSAADYLRGHPIAAGTLLGE